MKQYIVDAFTDKVFSGNPAAICILDEWLSDEIMLSIAKENNLSETAFAIKQATKDSVNAIHYKLRWFTPGGEIDLCGHATLACAFVIMNYYEKNLKTVIFDTLSGKLTVNRKNGDLYELDFPAYDLKKVEITDEMIELIGKKPTEAYLGRDLMCVFDDEEFILSANLDSEKIKKLDGLLLHITAQHSNYSLNSKIKNTTDKIDCISRSFAPKLNVYEDPVCGSGHCHIAPYWIKKLQKENLTAYQASKRSGMLYCSLANNGRMKMSGKAALFAISEIFYE
ncbi:PhzF family phenazine biosynthesis protein [Leptotrichia buccalis]|uniref:Phenazine biosynthesis protein PhzF family n=1 Tax=Leptotrichia buccalis (strain ATCC 14201 / DSM 1135 / JCM 12969 / NCTC 10249 / C-1013-b) TaxID=523794 RepID=C7NCH3_LEPBD|nr:PhzF family phenazine biosynthesis isomerase [Leptotrichia buccalis]ACV39819.1 phenazine biosynthesis protein PhzF family [Leptotrichia buccalis C-1013-b]